MLPLRCAELGPRSRGAPFTSLLTPFQNVCFLSSTLHCTAHVLSLVDHRREASTRDDAPGVPWIGGGGWQVALRLSLIHI